MRFYHAALIAVCLLLSSCSLFEQKSEEAQKEAEKKMAVVPPPLHLGAVHQVFPDQHFALLRIIGPMPAEGATLITHPPDGATDRVGNLCVSSGQHVRGSMIAADIRSGTVVKGDRVFLYQRIAPPEGKEQDDAPETAEEETGNDDTIIETSAATATGAATDSATSETDAAADDTADEEAPSPNPAAVDPGPAIETTILPKDNDVPSAPTAPSPRLEGIPDDISGWD